MNSIILASKSPRRASLLKELGYDFKIIAAEIDEYLDETKDIKDELIKLAERKAETIFNNNQDSIVIAADTICYLDHKIITKPTDRANAYQIIKNFSNNTHKVYTAVSVMKKAFKKSFIVESKVTFRKLSEQEINDYISDESIYDKAGAYAIQGRAMKYISWIEGDYCAIMGLPIARLSEILADIV